MNTLEALTRYYEGYDEAGRLGSRHGQVEFLTTLRYVEKYLRPGMRLLEIGAGTGRYSHHFARQGYEVDAVELLECNIEQFLRARQPGECVSIRQGNATSLSFLPENAYDVTLLLGPMYHLFTEEEQRTALNEALRVTRPGGVLFVAYCVADASVLQSGFAQGNARSLLDKGLLDPVTFRARSTPEAVFALHRREDIERMTRPLDAKRLHYVATDLFTNHIREAVDAMDDELFALYLAYHFSICEREDMVGATHHSLDILRKGKRT